MAQRQTDQQQERVMTLKVIRERLTDKCESDPRLVLEYINEDRRDDLAMCAVTMSLYSFSAECFQDAQDRANDIFRDAVEDYINEHCEQEEAEYMQEQREEAAEMRGQARRDEMIAGGATI
jgi:predicted nucleic acid-binding protein